MPAPLAIGPSMGGGGDAFILSTTKSGVPKVQKIVFYFSHLTFKNPACCINFDDGKLLVMGFFKVAIKSLFHTSRKAETNCPLLSR